MGGTILITGATSGIGMATASHFAGNGWRVIGCGRRAERLEKLRGELGDSFLPLRFDIRDRKQTAKAIANIAAPFAAIDVLLNNAGLFLGSKPFQEADFGDWEVMLETNIMGLLHCSRLILPGMLERRRGHIINIGSSTGTRPGKIANVYGSSKAFVRFLSDNMRADLLGSPIRVTCISPGRTRTEFSLTHSRGDSAAANKDYAVGEPLLPQDIAEAIWWVASRPARMDVTQMEIMPVCQADAGSVFADINF